VRARLASVTAAQRRALLWIAAIGLAAIGWEVASGFTWSWPLALAALCFYAAGLVAARL
jgi:hypothetical protein